MMAPASVHSVFPISMLRTGVPPSTRSPTQGNARPAAARLTVNAESSFPARTEGRPQCHLAPRTRSPCGGLGLERPLSTDHAFHRLSKHCSGCCRGMPRFGYSNVALCESSTNVDAKECRPKSVRVLDFCAEASSLARFCLMLHRQHKLRYSKPVLAIYR